MISEVKSAKLKEIELQEFGSEFISVSNLNFSFLVNDEIIGGVNLNVVLDSCDINFLFIKKDYRGNCFSIEMLIEVFLELKKRGINKIYLEVDTENVSAISLYLSVGFKEINRRIKYYSNGDDAIMMERVL